MKRIDMEIGKTLSLLNKSLFFKYLSDEEKTDLIRHSEMNQYGDKEKIIQEGNVDSFFCVILQGIVNISLKDNEDSVYITTLGEGDIIGEAAIFASFPRTANVICHENVIVLLIQREVFIDFIKKYPSSGVKLLMIIIHGLLTKLKIVDQELAYERTCHIDQNNIDEFITEYFSQK